MPPLIPIAISWIAGLIAGHHFLAPGGVQPAATALLGLIPLVALLLWRRDRTLVLVAVCTLTFLAGAVRYQLHLNSLQSPGAVVHQNNQGPVEVVGVVQNYPDVREGWTGLELEVEQLAASGEAGQAQGRVLLRTRRLPAFRYGDRLRVSGRLETPPEIEGFHYREFLAQQGILSQMWYPQIEKIATDQGSPVRTLIYTLRERASMVIARLMPEPEAALLQGILLGIRSGIPRSLYEDYNRTGTSHIIVISGANIMIVATLLARGFGRALGKRRAFWLTLAGICLYVVLVGADPVVIRAGIMGGLLVTAIYLGRRAVAYVSLAAAAMLLTLINPLTLWNVGFQLSAAATLGIILFTEPMERAITQCLHRAVPPRQAAGIVRMLSALLIVTLAAQVLTLPLVTYHFGQLSLVAPLSNLFVLSIQPHIMYWGAAATIAGMISYLEPLARVVAYVPWLLLAFTNMVVRWTASWPWASLPVGGFHAGWLAVYYGLILGLFGAVRHLRNRANAVPDGGMALTPTRALLGLSAVAIILTGLAIRQVPDGRLHVAFLDVGQGDGILITSPKGRQILVDGGPGPGAITSALSKEMPFWDHDIDLIVLTHADIDHIGGLPAVLERYEVHVWLDNGAVSDTDVYRRCRTLLQEAGVYRHVVQAGSRLDMEDGLSLEVLHPDSVGSMDAAADSNDSSVVLRLGWRQASFLLTGDLEAEGEVRLMQSGRPVSADVLKVSHHGSHGASMQGFLDEVAPSFAVISAGKDNTYGHPDPAVLERLAQLPETKILRTDEQGTVEFVTDGLRLWVQTER